MKKAFCRIVACLLAAAGIYGYTLVKDQKSLQDQLIRLHVVANSDSAEDQKTKLQVRDAILNSIEEDLKNVADPQQARAYLEEQLPKLQKTANDTLISLGIDPTAVVTFCKETFDTRYYDTFTLPAGIYDSLRITIGEGEGHNWWCVAYPSLCLGAAGKDVEAMAAQAGVTESAAGAITGKYELRFFLLDLLGKLQTRS